MTFTTYRAARNSLREFAPWLREKHRIIKFWSTTRERFLFTRVLQP